MSYEFGIDDGIGKQGRMSESYVWRYMSLAKYVDLLRSRSVFCPKASLFDDETEGKWIAHAVLWGEKQRWARIRHFADELQNILRCSKGDQDAILHQAAGLYASLDDEGQRSVLGDVLKEVPIIYPHKRQEYLQGTVDCWLRHHDNHNNTVEEWLTQVRVDRESTYISCWSLAESMSLAMWNLNGGGAESVAIRTTIDRLELLLERNRQWLQTKGLDGQIENVEYVDGLNNPGEELQEKLVSRLSVGKDVRIGAFSVKPELYSYENEVRLIVYPLRQAFDPVVDPHPELSGLSLQIGAAESENEEPLSAFIDAVHVHPLLDTNSMTVRVVKAVNEKFGLGDLPIVSDKVEAIGANLALQPIGYTDESLASKASL